MNTKGMSRSNQVGRRLSTAVAIVFAVMACKSAYADYNGTHVSCTGATIPPGQNLTYTITVQNTGSTTWYGYSVPAWIHKVWSEDCSWSPKPAWTTTTGYHWTSVAGGATASDTATFSASDLPTAPGTYTFWVYTYYPVDSVGNYSLMVGSPKQVSFTISTSFPEMDVQGNSVSIADGDASPSTTDHTDFGATPVTGGTVIRTFTIRNTGSVALNLTGSPRVSVGGTHASDFTVTSQPSTPVAAGGSTTFQVSFDPSAAGTRSATLSMANDDGNENPYNFSIQGTGAVPEMDVQGNSVSIVDGDSTPSTTDHTDFGSASVGGGTVVRTFTIRNTGSADLNLTGTTKVVVGGAQASEFVVSAEPTSPVAAGSTATFQVTFTPTATGTRNATLSIDNDDSNENPYNYSIRGTGTAPEIDVLGNSVSIVDGDSTPSLSDHTDFGSALVTGGTVVRTFTVRNTGSAALNLSGTPKVVVGGVQAAEFTVTAQPFSPVAAAGTTTFQVTFDPAGAGPRSATLSIANDDADENPYDFSIQGSGTAPEMDVQGNAVSIVDGDSTPSLTDHTDFGDALVAGGTVVRTYTIRNTGTAMLNLTGSPRVAVSGTHAADFTVTTQPAATVAAGGTAAFQVTFDPLAVGTRTAALSIANDDADASPYNYSIQGAGTTPPEMQTPEMGSGGTVVIRWTSYANHLYSLHHSTNLLNGFTVLDGDIQGTPPMNTYTDNVNGVSTKFWKVSTEE